MSTLPYSHEPWLVLASLAVALIAGFTGLTLTRGLSDKSVTQRKVAISIAAVALGGGIWSMHFVAMLGLRLPILFYYDALVTLISALVAILVVGAALLLLHFRERTRASVTGAGALVGLGILAMHYIGMSGLELCRAVYTPTGIAVAAIASVLLSIAAFRIAYGARTGRNVALGTVCFGAAVFAVHFIAIAGTGFVAVPDALAAGPAISPDTLAMGVVLTSFVLCGAFLLTGVTVLLPAPTEPEEVQAALPDPLPEPPAPAKVKPLPYEQEGRTRFIDPAEVAAIRAEGHYTILYSARGKLFCQWSITEVEKRLRDAGFLRVHRSYLVNPAHVTGFDRDKDKGHCHFTGMGTLEKVPVARGRIPEVREALGI